MSDAATYKNADLRHMLRQRGLRVSGNKAELVSRLTAYGTDHPFRFLNLPGEIRNEIYKYVAAFQHTQIINCRGFTHRIPVDVTENQASIMPPGLFRTCSQIYTESRALFYRHHVFKLHVWQEHKGVLNHLAALFGLWHRKTCLERVTRWLDVIGEGARKQIRTLEIEVYCYDPATVRLYTRFVDDLHARLSDEATVVYHSGPWRNSVLILWELGKIFYDRDPSRVPQLELPSWSRIRGNGNLWALTRDQLLHSPTRYRVQRPNLTFGPGLGWFGRHKGTVGWWVT